MRYASHDEVSLASLLRQREWVIEPLKVRCPTCKTVLRVSEPEKPVEGKPVGSDYTDLLGFLNLYTCDHPDNVKVNGRCLACKPHIRPSSP